MCVVDGCCCGVLVVVACWCVLRVALFVAMCWLLLVAVGCSSLVVVFYVVCLHVGCHVLVNASCAIVVVCWLSFVVCC